MVHTPKPTLCIVYSQAYKHSTIPGTICNVIFAVAFAASSTYYVGMPNKPLRRCGSKYPWEEWLSRPKITLRYGEHYHCTTASIKTVLSRAARVLAIKVYVDGTVEGQLTVTVLGKE